MRVLYINIKSLLFSERFLENNEQAQSIYDAGLIRTESDIVNHMPVDRVAAKTLERAAIDAGFKIYPLVPKHCYSIVRQRRIFSETVLAPDINWNERLRMGDGEIKALKVHASESGVRDWYCYGNLCWFHLQHEKCKYLKSPPGLG
ncbi:hypothetical protein LRP52_28845, partial [Photobacterium sp. ZSDE20]|nr:hypothetical protein [Photobacterium sp. ZSDE20]